VRHRVPSYFNWTVRSQIVSALFGSLAVCNTLNQCMPLFIANGRGKGKGKGKVRPRTGHEGPEGE